MTKHATVSQLTTNASDQACVETTGDWHDRPLANVIDFFKTDPDDGLTSATAQTRLAQHGPNELEEAPGPTWQAVLVGQFTDVLIGILFVAAVISFAVGEVVDAIAILVIVVLNGVLGFVQEWRAEKALEALRNMLELRCTVIRDGHRVEIDASDVVPGDIVELAIGDQVPADLRLVETIGLRTDESMLTGESEAVAKTSAPVDPDTALAGRTSMAWMGTSVANGRGSGVAVATGMSTELGRIAGLTQSVDSGKTPLQVRLTRLGRQLGVIAVAVSFGVAAVGWLLGRPLLDMFLTGVSLAVAVVPEGLPAVVTITLALGVRSMVKRRALLRSLQAAETLGSATVICTDKTGTLTANQMTVRKIWLPSGTLDVTGTGYDPAGHFESDGTKIDYRDRTDLLALLEAGQLCNHASIRRDDQGWHHLGEPTEAALIVAAYKAWLHPEDSIDTVTEFSFNSLRKRMTVVVHRPQRSVAYVKGAPEVLLPRIRRIRQGDTLRTLTDDDRDGVIAAFTGFAEQGLRTLAIAERTLPADIALDEDAVETDLTLLGIAGILDPPRPEVAEAISTARRAGITPIMITGDAPQTAIAIAHKVGLSAPFAVTGPELDVMTDTELAAAVRNQAVFARTAPEHKLRIVTLLQEQGEVVAMTGDGVNDSPALRAADIGIAMGQRGTDVAKAAADVVLTDDNFASIIAATEEGRRQYDNIRKFVRYLLSSNVGELVAIVVNLLTGGPLILLPVQILWMNLVTDGVTAVALGVEPGAPDLMGQPPHKQDEPILSARAFALIVAVGAYIGLATFGLFDLYLDANSTVKAQTMAFTAIVIIEKVNVFNFRSLRRPLAQIGFFSNPVLLVAWAGTVGLQVAAVYLPPLQNVLHTVPLTWTDWLVIAAVAAPILLIGETVKWLRSRSDGVGPVAAPEINRSDHVNA
ncbi:MAG: HAD-IC family P-type ATPase [Acidimicrobiia bacterium]|nr:HAD-IC family P-type ATPase [Acidimicrobiia bacterium]MDX2468526.1 HAD-IC family P-type ATPase [Acidimicrobiia bacterium]